MISTIEWIRTRLRAGQLLILLATGGLATGLIFWVNLSGTSSSPETVVQEYLASLYAQDYDRAYEFISAVDRAYKSREAYLRENIPLTGFSLEAARQLATYIEYPEIQTEKQGDERAVVMVKFAVPDGNAEAVRAILFLPPQAGSELSEAERQNLLTKLDRLHHDGQIPSLTGEETFELVKEPEGWRILENWAEAVRVHFSGEVKDGLPWEFEPLQEVVLAEPGETLQTVYRVKNLSDRLVTAKARHLDEPEAYRDYLNIVQCFCFIQQSLRPGEEAELPLIFRVEWNIPAEVRDFYVHYEFYPVESFPEE